MPTVRAGDIPYQPFNSEEPSPRVPSAYQNIRSTGADFGETIGVATEKLGAVIGQGANVFAEGAIARQQLENQVRADDQTNKYQEAVTKILHGDPDNPTDTGFLGKRGEAATRDYNDTYKSIVDLRNTMRGQLANDRQRLSFDNESRKTQIFTLSKMGEHYDREFKNYATAVNTAGATNAMARAATALAGNRQAEFESELGENMKYKLKQAELMGTASNAEVVNNILASTREDAVKMKFLKLSETNPYAAKQFLDSNTDALKPGEAHMLFKSIEPQWRKIQSAIDNKEMEAPEGWNEPSRSTYDPAHVDTTGTGVGHVAPKAERLAYYKQRAAELGLNYKAVVATVANEGLHTFVGDNGKSFGDFQLYTGGGMGNEAEAAGVNIRDPKYWKEAGDFALKQMAAHKGDAQWFNDQWHGPRDNAPWAANQFSQPDLTVTGRGAPLTPAQLREGTSGSSAEAEILLADAGGADTIEKKAPVPGMKLAPIPPPDAGEPPDASIPGLTEKIADLASQPWAKENPTRLLDAIKYARTQANMRWTDSQRQLQLHREQMKAQGDAVDDSYMKRMYPGSPNPPSVQEVQQDKRLDMHPDVRRKIISFMERENKIDPLTQISKGNTMELYRRMTLDDGKEGKITSEKPFDQAYTADPPQITRQDHDWLVKEFRDQRSAGNENLKDLKNRIITAAKPAILGPYAAADERLIEPDAAIKLFGYTEAINKKIKEYQDTGRNPADLFNTENKDFVGSDGFIHPYASTLGEQARARARARDMGITPGGPPIPPPMGVPPPDFSKVSNEDLIMGINSKKIDADIGIKELERRGYGRRAAPPVAPAPSTEMR